MLSPESPFIIIEHVIFYWNPLGFDCWVRHWISIVWGIE